MKEHGQFVWQSRPAKSCSGFFTMVGGYEVIVYERTTGWPVTGATIVASESELDQKIGEMLDRLGPRFAALPPADREAALELAADTARSLGWPDCAPAPASMSSVRRLPDEGRLHEICWGVIANDAALPLGAQLLKVARLVAIDCGADDPAWADEKGSPL